MKNFELNKTYTFQYGAYGTPFQLIVLSKTDKAIKVKLIESKFKKDIYWIPLSVIEDFTHENKYVLKNFYKFDN